MRPTTSRGLPTLTTNINDDVFDLSRDFFRARRRCSAKKSAAIDKSATMIKSFSSFTSRKETHFGATTSYTSVGGTTTRTMRRRNTDEGGGVVLCAKERKNRRRRRDARRHMGRIIAESSEDEDEMETRSSTITLDMLEKAEDQFWEESMDTLGEGSYDDSDDDDAKDDALGEGTVMVVRRTKQTNARRRRNAQMGNGRKSVQGSNTARDVVLRSSERAMEISKRAAERAEFVRRQLEAVPNKKEIISATAAVTAVTAAISTAISEPLMTMAGSIVAFSLVKSFETMDKQLRQKQREIETKKREENVNLLMKSKERKVETKVEVVDTPLEVVSATTTIEDVTKKEEGKIVEKEEEILAPAAATTATTATTTAKSISATGAFASKIASENESAVFEARKRREKILNEMAQYDDARLNSIVRATGEMAETTTTNSNTNFANRASKRTSDTLGYNATPPRNFPEEAVNSTTSTEKREDERDEKMQKISLFEAFFAVFTFPFTLLYELFRECVEVLKRFFVNQNNAKVA